MAWMSAKGQLAPVLAVIAVATVAAVAVIATHTSGPGPAALMPRPFVKNGVRMVPHRIYELPAGKPLPKGAVVIKPSVLKRMVPMKHAVYHNAPGLKLSATVPAPAARPVVRAQKTSAGLKVAKAFPLHSNLENHGKYGHEAEEILTTHRGAVRVAKGSFKSHLRGAAPAVSVQAAPKLRSKRDMSMHQQARELAEALDDCRDDPSDDCQTELHLGSNDKQVKAFEEDQDAADKGLFRIFESAQRVRDANGIRIAPGGMLAQMPPPVAAIPGQSSSGRVDGFGIPDGGSLPGDNV